MLLFWSRCVHVCEFRFPWSRSVFCIEDSKAPVGDSASSQAFWGETVGFWKWTGWFGLKGRVVEMIKMNIKMNEKSHFLEHLPSEVNQGKASWKQTQDISEDFI